MRLLKRIFKSFPISNHPFLPKGMGKGCGERVINKCLVRNAGQWRCPACTAPFWGMQKLLRKVNFPALTTRSFTPVGDCPWQEVVLLLKKMGPASVGEGAAATAEPSSAEHLFQVYYIHKPSHASAPPHRSTGIRTCETHANTHIHTNTHIHLKHTQTYLYIPHPHTNNTHQ